MSQRFGPDELLSCYRRGVFPMADAHDDPNLFLIDPDERGVLPLETFHIPTRLRRTLRQEPYDVTADMAFTRVIEACAERTSDRQSTWINATILNLYAALHRRGRAHSIECWLGDRLVGGLYGVSLGAVFFGESMFSRERDASKIALAHLAARLISGGYRLLDAQFHNPHLEQFGLEEISRAEFKARLADALESEGDFYSPSAPSTGRGVVQLITQMS
ncbi:MAG: leucyl/phenylalanyl-tRNA--protein transferase [Pseudomonadota bacterium]